MDRHFPEFFLIHFLNFRHGDLTNKFYHFRGCIFCDSLKGPVVLCPYKKGGLLNKAQQAVFLFLFNQFSKSVQGSLKILRIPIALNIINKIRQEIKTRRAQCIAGMLQGT